MISSLHLRTKKLLELKHNSEVSAWIKLKNENYQGFVQNAAEWNLCNTIAHVEVHQDEYPFCLYRLIFNAACSCIGQHRTETVRNMADLFSISPTLANKLYDLLEIEPEVRMRMICEDIPGDVEDE